MSDESEGDEETNGGEIIGREVVPCGDSATGSPKSLIKAKTLAKSASL